MKGMSRTLQILNMLWLLYIFVISGSVLGSGGDICLEHEKQALLKFKEGLLDYGNLVSWSNGEDCCRWRGVECDNQTGHIILLDLRPIFSYSGQNGISWNPMDGEISSSLLDLRYLSYLDLSWNRFTRIPEFIGSLDKLVYLNLSGNSISGTIPYQLGNLSRLLSLDVSNNNDDMTIENLEWLSSLSSLRTLKLSRTNLTKAVTWLQSFQSHPSLSSLYLQDCQFPEVDPSSLSHINSSKSLAVLHLTDSTIFHPSILPLFLNMSNKLTDLRLSNNQLKGSIPNSFDNMGSLEHLDVSANQLEGGIPKPLGNLCKLKTLLLNGNKIYETFSLILEKLGGCAKDSLEILNLSVNQINGPLPDIRRFSSLKELYLDGNKLEGPVPDGIGNLSSLTVLSLAGNKLTGSLPLSIGQMSSLKVLDVSSNSLNGVISEIHLLKLSKMEILSLSFNSLSLKFSSGWVPPFQLDTINMRSCKLGPSFPSWLQTQRNFSHLDISNSKISDDVPDWFWSLPSNLVFLNVSFNNLSGRVPDLQLRFNSFPLVVLRSNQFYGPIPRFLFNTTVLNLSKNMFSGNLSALCSMINSNLNHVYLSDNLLSGTLPDCWMNFRQLVVLNLESNNLSGVIPSSVDSLYKLQTLRLSNNNFSGELPPSLRNCRSLKLLDLGENKLSGNISAWIGENLLSLIVLRLRSNEFSGNIPSTLCKLDSLQILDLSLNHISGTIPTCLENFTAMTRKGSSDATIEYTYLYSDTNWDSNADTILPFAATYIDYASVVWKGVEQQYGNTLGLLKVIDLSSNNLTGEIPGELTRLVELITLNLSRNTLSGIIPKEIGQLKALESLDLSTNRLSGEIPLSLADLSFLSYLNLSNNNLWGKIPSSTQLQSFHATSYMGNRGLCGLPLNTICPGDEKEQDGSTANSNLEDEKWYKASGFYISAGVGFTLGFWGVCGALVFTWLARPACFQFLTTLVDWLCLTISLNSAKVRRLRS